MTTASTAVTITARAKGELLHHHHYRHPHSAVCDGDGCITRDLWPLLHVRHRGIFCRLCASCVLRYHPGFFCLNCFEFFDGRGTQPPSAVVHCAGCPSVSHTACLPDPDRAAHYLCPICANPNGFSYFPSKKARVSDGGVEQTQLPDGRCQQTIDRKYSKMLVAATRLATSSMNRAAAATRIEAERKVKEAAVAKKRAEESILAVKRERERERRIVVVPEVVVEPKRKTTPKLGSVVAAATTAAQKRMKNRGREKWMKLHNPIPLAQRSPVQAIMENDRFKGSHVGGPLNRTPGLTTGLPNHVKHEEKGNNGIFLASQSSFIAENERGTLKLPVESDMGDRVTLPNPDAPVAKTNPRAIFTGSSNTTRVHS